MIKHYFTVLLTCFVKSVFYLLTQPALETEPCILAICLDLITMNLVFDKINRSLFFTTSLVNKIINFLNNLQFGQYMLLYNACRSLLRININVLYQRTLILPQCHSHVVKTQGYHYNICCCTLLLKTLSKISSIDNVLKSNITVLTFVIGEILATSQ